MEQKYYRLVFIDGELSGRSFSVPPEGVMIGKSRSAAIRPGGGDIAIEHVSLRIRETDFALVLTAHDDSAVVGETELDPGAETVLEPGIKVRLGKNLVFVAEEDDEAFPPSESVFPEDDEATDDATTDGGSDGDSADSEAGGKDDSTRYASVDELNDLRHFSQKTQGRRKFVLAFGFFLILAILFGGYLYSYLQLENPVTWPGELNNNYNDGEFRFEPKSGIRFLIYYPECDSTQVKKDEKHCEVFTLLGKNYDVVYHLKLDVNQVPNGFTVPRQTSFDNWRRNAEEKLGFSFQNAPEQKFYATSTCGIPYQTMNYKRSDETMQWQGIVCYLRYHDQEIVFTREVPVQHYWRAEKVVNQYGCFVASSAAANSNWEIPENIPQGLSKTELYRTILEKMSYNVALIDWPEINRQFAILLSLSGQDGDETMMDDTLDLLQEFRERQKYWYSQACLAYQHFEQNDKWENMKAIRNECLLKFPSSDDYRHTKIIRNIWTIDE